MSVFGLRGSQAVTSPWVATAPRRTRPTAGSFMRLVAIDDAVVLVGLVAVAGAGSRRWWGWAAAAVTLLTLTAADRYRARITLSVAHDVWVVTVAVGAPLVVAAALRPAGLDAPTLVLVGGIALALMLVQRVLLFAHIRSLRTRGVLCDRTLVIGAGPVGVGFTDVLREHPEFGLQPIGFLDDVDSAGLPLPVLGSLDLLRMVLSEERVDRVVVAFGVTRESAMIDMLRACDDSPVEIHMLPRFFELGLAANRRFVDDVWGYPLVRLRRPRVSGVRWRAKRVFDVLVAGGSLLMLSPLYGALALAVKLTSPGPVHFRQERIGQRGTPVEILKFRSMRIHSNSDTEWNAEPDMVTGLGRVMRTTGLDEIPQLWNIVRGDMSLVGPRPERPFFVEQFKAEIPRYDHRHRVPVGLTGEAQIHGLRGDTSIDERARFDNNYIENWSLWRDIVILFRTTTAVVRHARANRVDVPVDTPVASVEVAGTDLGAGPGHHSDSVATSLDPGDVGPVSSARGASVGGAGHFGPDGAAPIA